MSRRQIRWEENRYGHGGEKKERVTKIKNKEYHLLLSWSRHGEERLEAKYNKHKETHIDTHRHTNTHSQDKKVQKEATKQTKRRKRE